MRIKMERRRYVSSRSIQETGVRFAMLSVAGLLVAASGWAQVPRITPRGDPSVRDDSIYALAVRPADHPDESYVYLLDDGVVRIEADGRGSRTYRQVVQVLDREAAEQWGAQSFSYVSSRERFTLNWARVLRSDGQVISKEPTHEQEATAPAAASAPVYSDMKVHQITLAGVEPGALVRRARPRSLPPGPGARFRGGARRRAGADARRLPPAAAPVGSPGLPLRLDRPRHRGVPAAARRLGFRDEVRRLQGQGHAVH